MWRALVLLTAVVLADCSSYPVAGLQAGMTRDDVVALYRRPLKYLAGPPRSEIYVVERTAAPGPIGPDFIAEKVYLKFVDGRLSAWKTDAQICGANFCP